MKPVPLRLVLDPVLPMRTPDPEEFMHFGYRLRLPRGPGVRFDDPLLAAFGATLSSPDVDGHEEELQSDTFEPGQVVRLTAQRDAEGDSVSVWDGEEVRQAGALVDPAASVALAGIAAGLEPRGIVLWEDRGARDDRREAIGLLVFAPSLVRVRLPAKRIERPQLPSRPRLVLVAGASSAVRWWDPTITRGPLEAGDVPLSSELRAELELLNEAFATLADGDIEPHGIGRLGATWEREALDDEAAALWRRARMELGRRYAVGFLGSGMRRPVWSPGELGDADGASADIPF